LKSTSERYQEVFKLFITSHPSLAIEKGEAFLLLTAFLPGKTSGAGAAGTEKNNQSLY